MKFLKQYNIEELRSSFRLGPLPPMTHFVTFLADLPPPKRVTCIMNGAYFTWREPSKNHMHTKYINVNNKEVSRCKRNNLTKMNVISIINQHQLFRHTNPNITQSNISCNKQIKNFNNNNIEFTITIFHNRAPNIYLPNKSQGTLYRNFTALVQNPQNLWSDISGRYLAIRHKKWPFSSV